ncbi:MAG TPA: hypothetical protein VGO52_10435 [Hyphomonadaceae bacterium]|nr:hypothetical protein [Hyphomonadaceae bacterium]
MKALVDYCVEFASLMLQKKGAFLPFGAELRSDGQQAAVAGMDGNEHPKPAEIYSIIENGFGAKARSGEIIAGAIAVDVNVPPTFDSPFADGIRVQLETPGNSRLIYFPYRLTHSGLILKKRALQVAEAFAVELEPKWFSPAAMH